MSDIYEYDPPEAHQSWADLFHQNQETVKTVVGLVSIPTGLFVLTCIANYYIEKKVKSL